MSEVSEDDLQKEILKILEKANLAKTSTKKVRQRLEEIFDIDLTEKKELIDQYVMDYVNKMESEDSDEEEVEEKKKPAPKKRKKRKASDEWVEKKPKKATKSSRRKGSGYTKTCKLSPPLAALMGQDEMARHEVVSRMWAIVKEKKLYDPKNRQFAICDEALYKVIGIKRFKTFGMMKYLKTHFLD